jgi:GH35 family endo-1,4-beta-xylanase
MNAFSLSIIKIRDLKFNMKKQVLSLCISFVAVSCSVAQKANSWNDPEVVRQMDSNIEKYRKSDGTITVIDKNGKPVANATVVIKQQASEFKFGSNLFVLHQLASPELNRKYEEGFLKLFNFATIPFYWAELEPLQDSLRFNEGAVPMWRRPPPDEMVKWCKAHNILIKGHPMLYIKSKFMPGWLPKNDPETLRAVSEKHMMQLAQRYGKDVAIWDVINEDVARLKNPSVWHAAPADYLAWAFKKADSLFSKSTTLLINDETKTAHDSTEQYVASINSLLQNNIRVDGIGIQFHMLKPKEFLSGEFFPPAKLQNAYEDLGKLGKPMWITEITVPSRGENGFQNQATIVKSIYKMPHMKGITWWNLGDGTAFGTENSFLGGLLDSAMNPKPAYKVLDQLINHDWRTNLTLKTDAKGTVRFRGFHGSYSVQISEQGKKKKEVPFILQSTQNRTQEKVVLNE